MQPRTVSPTWICMHAAVADCRDFGPLERNSLGLFSHLDYSVKVQGLLPSNLSRCENTLGLLASELWLAYLMGDRLPVRPAVFCSYNFCLKINCLRFGSLGAIIWTVNWIKHSNWLKSHHVNTPLWSNLAQFDRNFKQVGEGGVLLFFVFIKK